MKVRLSDGFHLSQISVDLAQFVRSLYGVEMLSLRHVSFFLPSSRFRGPLGRSLLLERLRFFLVRESVRRQFRQHGLFRSMFEIPQLSDGAVRYQRVQECPPRASDTFVYHFPLF